MEQFEDGEEIAPEGKLVRAKQEVAPQPNITPLRRVKESTKVARAVAPTGEVELPRLNLLTMKVTLIGDSPLIVHRWSEKAKKEMRDKQMKKAKPAKEAKNPDQDFKEAMYRLADGGHGFPVVGFKAAAVTACTSIGGVTKVAARQAFRVKGELTSDGEMARIEGAEPKMREDMVRIAQGTADLRYRPEYFPWHTELTIVYNANMMSHEQILNMLNTAGFGVGVGEWRPEKDGQAGLFHVADEDEVQAIAAERKKLSKKG